jgi:enamine deaminase RidA (YjgF/YER057c/UK114 family)
VDGGIREQAARVLENMGAILAPAGLDFCHVVKTTVFLKEMKDFSAMNEVYAQFFSSPETPSFLHACGWAGFCWLRCSGR